MQESLSSNPCLAAIGCQSFSVLKTLEAQHKVLSKRFKRQGKKKEKWAGITRSDSCKSEGHLKTSKKGLLKGAYCNSDDHLIKRSLTVLRLYENDK